MTKTKTFRPLLAATCQINEMADLSFPYLASPKLDGIRCVIRDGVPLSRTLKPIPNLYVNEVLKSLNLPDLDGELIVGGETAHGVFDGTQSGIMTIEGTPDFKYYVFDCVSSSSSSSSFQSEVEITPITPFSQRLQFVREYIADYNRSVGDAKSFLKYVDHTFVGNLNRLMNIEELYVSKNYEGVMLRDPNGPYKFGRSTFSQGTLIKIKRFHSAEGKIVGFSEEMENTNEAKLDNLGLKKRSSHKENKVPKGVMGELILELDQGELVGGEIGRTITFGLGTGFSAAQRKEIWDNRTDYLGKIVQFKYQELTVAEGKPRFASFSGFRHEDDM